MRVVIVSAVFPPEPVVSAQTSFDIVQELIKNKNFVTVLTSFPNRPAGNLFSDYKRKLYSHKRDPSGFELIRCFHTLSTESSMSSRLAENISFGITSSLALLILPKPDIVYTNTWAIFAAIMLNFVCWLRQIPVVNSIQDVYPESLISQKRLKETSLLIKVMKILDSVIARNSNAIIVLSEQFKNIYELDRGISPDRIHIIPNWSSLNFVDDSHGSSLLRKELGIPSDSFLVVFGGNIGEGAGVEDVVESFRFLQEESIFLLIAGSGPNLAKCQRIATEFPKKKIFFISPWGVEDTAIVLGMANLLILPTRGLQSFVSVPSKLISYLFSGRPILALAQEESELEIIVKSSNSGWVLAPDNPEKLATKMKEIMSFPPKTLASCGLSGRNYALKYLTRNESLTKIIQLLNQCARKVRK